MDLQIITGIEKEDYQGHRKLESLLSCGNADTDYQFVSPSLGALPGPEVDAANCAPGLNCRSKDLHVTGATVNHDADHCVTCKRCEQVNGAELKMIIVNPTGSQRPTAGIIGFLQETVPSDCLENPDDPPVTTKCPIARCHDPAPLSALPGKAGEREFTVGKISYTCGSELKFLQDDLRLFWTDASTRSHCGSFVQCKDFRPKCDAPDTNITVETGISVGVNASCIEGTANIEVVATVTGGKTPYTYAWVDSNSNIVGTDRTLSPVSDGVYTVTVTDASGCVSDPVSNKKQNCCSIVVNCRNPTVNLVACHSDDVTAQNPPPHDKSEVFNITVVGECGTMGDMTGPIVDGDPTGVLCEHNIFEQDNPLTVERKYSWTEPCLWRRD